VVVILAPTLVLTVLVSQATKIEMIIHAPLLKLFETVYNPSLLSGEAQVLLEKKELALFEVLEVH
jgi:hypothetical protein